MECDKMPLILREFQVPSLVEKNELASEEELEVKMMEVEEQHPWMRIEIFWLGVTSSISLLIL